MLLKTKAVEVIESVLRWSRLTPFCQILVGVDDQIYIIRVEELSQMQPRWSRLTPYMQPEVKPNAGGLE